MPSTRPRKPDETDAVALLIDGENIPVTFAKTILQHAAKQGDLTVKRIYGNAARLAGWDAEPGLRLVHSGSGKNGADILLSIEATDLGHRHDIDTFVIVTSDADFSHLAHHLRERHFKVVGIGEKKAPPAFRKACDQFVEVGKEPVKMPANLDKMDRQIHELIQKEEGNGIKISALGARMNALHKVQISQHEAKTWRGYLSGKPELYDLDKRGKDARVRLKST